MGDWGSMRCPRAYPPFRGPWPPGSCRRPAWVRKEVGTMPNHMLSQPDSGRCWADGLLSQMDNARGDTYCAFCLK
eukprot:1353819-Pyramimonas_sp.AAC.1